MSVFDKITDKALFDFGNQINVQDVGSVGDRLFPNMKTEYPEVEYMRLANSPSLPHAAMIHGFDTEAVIGRREPVELVTVDEFLIKEKMNLTETEKRYRRKGLPDSTILDYIFDDAGREVRAVRARAEAAKFEVLQTGKMQIRENNVNLEVDYGVPDSNRYDFNWFALDHDIIGDIKPIIKGLRSKGWRVNRAMTSTTVMDMLCSNVNIQKMVNGNVNAGILVTEDGVNALFRRLFDLEIEVNDEYYTYTAADGTEQTARYFDEYSMVFYQTNANGAVGTGIWGVTPEEEDSTGFDESGAGYGNIIFLSQWRDKDPVVRWIKASGVFIPVLPSPQSHVIINICNGTTVRKYLDVTTSKGSSSNKSKINVYPAVNSGNSLYYQLGDVAVDVGDTLTISEWSSLTNNTEITVSGKKAATITVVEVSSETVEETTTYTVVGVGYSAINKA
jgi:hypothetical protein